MFIHSESDTYHRSLLAKAGVLSAVFGIALLFPAPAALAQGSTETTLEEITVTSRRYEESIEDAPVAVSVMTE